MKLLYHVRYVWYVVHCAGSQGKKGYVVSCRIQSALIDVSLILCLYGTITLITLFTTTNGRSPEQDKPGYNFHTATPPPSVC